MKKNEFLLIKDILFFKFDENNEINFVKSVVAVELEAKK